MNNFHWKEWFQQKGLAFNKSNIASATRIPFRLKEWLPLEKRASTKGIVLY